MNGIVTWTAAAIGVALLAVGVLGFVDNPIVGEPNGSEPIFVTGLVHNIVHLVTGALALVIAFGMRGETQAQALIGFGLLYGVVLVLGLIDADLFGILEHPMNTADHILHVALTVIPIGVGWYAMNRERSVAT